jgi:hypothetical protein
VPFALLRESFITTIIMVVVDSSLMVRFLETAADKYDNIVEFKTDSILNHPAPEPRVTFTIGAVRHNIDYGWMNV